MTHNRLFTAILGLALTCLVSNSGLAQSGFTKNFVDTTDNAFDMSPFLNSVGGFLPVPIIITEPAVGFGGGLTAVVFHRKKKKNNPAPRKGSLPPIMTAAGGAYTSNGTWLAFLGHQGSYKQDRFRYTGAIGGISANLAYYNENLIGDRTGVNYNMKGIMTFHEFLVRPKKEMPLFLGLNYVFFNNDVTFKTGIDIPELEELTFNTSLGGMNAVLLWDSRDNTFTPTRGIMSAFELGWFSKYLGGDNDYGHFMSRTYAYLPIVEDKLFSGYRLSLESKGEEAPFFEQPFVKLRGIPMMRYQEQHVGILETEWRYQFFRRWSLVGFFGVGFALPDFEDVLKNQGRPAGGLGFRYFLARDYGIHAGVDVARGPEQWAWYLTIGSNWFR